MPRVVPTGIWSYVHSPYREQRIETQNWIKTFKKSSHSEVKGFVRVDVCIPANSMSVVRVADLLQNDCSLQY